MSDAAGGDDRLLRVRDLQVHFPVEQGVVFKRQVGAIRAVDGVDFDLRRGETLGLVGESGCGKTTVARAVAQLVPVTAGSIRFQGSDLVDSSRHDLLQSRMALQVIFQDPYASLNPRMTAGTIIGEPLEIYTRRGMLELSRAEIRHRVEELMERVGLSRRFFRRYPHEFSGGQRQRIGIARALALNPTLILADEPISALDVSIQSQILNLLMDLQDELQLTYLFISHDLSVIEHISDRVAVMYLGRIVEIADAERLYANPLHPYTEALLSAVPIPDPKTERERRRIILSGDVPSPDRVLPGCPFADRCPRVMPGLCDRNVPRLQAPAKDAGAATGDAAHQVSCFLYNEPDG